MHVKAPRISRKRDIDISYQQPPGWCQRGRPARSGWLGPPAHRIDSHVYRHRYGHGDSPSIVPYSPASSGFLLPTSYFLFASGSAILSAPPSDRLCGHDEKHRLD
ncbi:hypothetical protein F503_02899 [Ophiostoma piceae UAMH 11346]|uniref:Uncharacterized protein n=1 Tax=Ophiostoma piceae (strain UAMH 11346) TaxID=1262450 RepID=S3CYR9_OPHP1|nr:hypothetical protein F503_02899 [Ophiostoma piceae UAMH 11346]